MRLFGFAAIVLFVLGLICIAVPTSIAGGGWKLWDTAGLLATALELFLPAGIFAWRPTA